MSFYMNRLFEYGSYNIYLKDGRILFLVRLYNIFLNFWAIEFEIDLKHEV